MATSPLSFSNNEEAQKYLDVQDELMKALENRAQPNLFQVAGALAKPTRTGSALEALGEGASEYGRQLSEQQKLEPSMIQMRSSMAAQKYKIGQDVQANNMLNAYLNKEPELFSSIQESISNGEPVSNQKMSQLFKLMEGMPSDTEAFKKLDKLYSAAKEMAHTNYEQSTLSETKKKNLADVLGPLTEANAQSYADSGILSPKSINSMLGKEVIKLTEPIEPISTQSKTVIPMTITSGFGQRINPITKQPEFHAGIDIGGKEGTPIVPINQGKVVKVEKNTTGFGNRVMVQHPDGTTSYYAHMQDINVKEGDSVTPNTPIGTLGRTGMSTGPHTEVGIIKDGKPVDPMPFIKGKSIFAQLNKPQINDGVQLASNTNGSEFVFREQYRDEPRTDYLKRKEEATQKYLEDERKISNISREDSAKRFIAAPEKIKAAQEKYLIGENIFNTVSNNQGAFGLMYKSNAFARAVGSILSEGLNVGSFKINLPVEKWAQKFSLNPQEVQALQQIESQLNQLAIDQASQMKGSVSNYEDAMVKSVNGTPSNTPGFLKYISSKQIIQGKFEEKTQNLFLDYLEKNPKSTYTAFTRSKEYQDESKKYQDALIQNGEYFTKQMGLQVKK